jgi:hypothetical protein
MVAKLIGKLSAGRREKVVATVRESALSFLSLLRSQGFLARGFSREYFDDPVEDAYGMVYELTGDSDAQ